MSKIISIRVDESLLEKIKKLAEKERRTLNNFIIKTLSDCTDKRGVKK